MSENRSKTTQQQQTANTSASLQGTSGVAIIGGSAPINVTDGGAVHDAFSFLGNADAALTDRFGMILDAGSKILQTGQQQAAATVAAVQSANDAAKNPNNNLMMAGIVAASVVGAFAIMRK